MTTGAIVLALISACKTSTPTAPQSTPTPSPAFPFSKSNSTILENIALIRNLEEGVRGRQTIFFFLSGAATQEGRVLPGSRWRYQFGGMVNNRPQVYEWNVVPSGQVEYHGERSWPVSIHPPMELMDIASVATVDSPEMVRLARTHGGQPFVDRFPDAYAELIYRFFAGQPVCELQFYRSGAPCTHGPIYIHARTGELMARNLSCLDKLTAP